MFISRLFERLEGAGLGVGVARDLNPRPFSPSKGTQRSAGWHHRRKHLPGLAHQLAHQVTAGHRRGSSGGPTPQAGQRPGHQVGVAQLGQRVSRSASTWCRASRCRRLPGHRGGVLLPNRAHTHPLEALQTARQICVSGSRERGHDGTTAHVQDAASLSQTPGRTADRKSIGAPMVGAPRAFRAPRQNGPSGSAGVRRRKSGLSWITGTAFDRSGVERTMSIRGKACCQHS